MQRGSSRLNVHRDDEMKHELKGLLRSGHSTRSEEWHDPEPAADDDPDLAIGAGDVRSEMAKQLRRKDFPADKEALGRTLADRHAPDRWTRLVDRLPEGRVFHRVQEVVQALSEESGPRGGAPGRRDRPDRG
jgi:Protein of unknown function (DUF2795)